MDLMCVYTALTDCLCCSAGQHVAIHLSGGASGCRRNRHWSGKCCPHGWNRDISSDHRIHFRHQEQVIMLCAAKLSTTHSLICGLSSRVGKIPLWRWQWMVIYMLINAFGCIISSVLLNIVDHRQVRQRTNTRIQAHTHTSTHTLRPLFNALAAGTLLIFILPQGRILNNIKCKQAEKDDDGYWTTNGMQKNWRSDLLSSEVWVVLFFIYFPSYFFLRCFYLFPYLKKKKKNFE